MASKVAKVTKLPEFLRNIDTSTLARFQETAGIDMFQLSGHYQAVYFRDKGRSVLSYHPGFYHADEDERVLLLEDTRNRNSTTRILYVEDNGTLWNADISIVFKTIPEVKYNYTTSEYDDPTWTSPIVTSFHVSPWTIQKKFENYFGAFQSKSEIEGIVKGLNPYAYPWLKQRGYDLLRYLMAPYLETIVKAGYAFAEAFLEYGHTRFYMAEFKVKSRQIPCKWEKSYIDALNRLCQIGTDPKSIFKMSPILFKALKEEKEILIWDEFRKLDKRISNPIAVKRLVGMELKKDHVKYICEILKKEYHEKPVISVDALQKYLERVNVYEAIELDEALPLIRDYIVSCLNINKKPIFTGDSLKREHDVTVRMNRDFRNEAYSSKIVTVGHKLEKYGYQEDTFFIRPIKDYDDLNDESMQQGNCLSAVYPARIANERSYIFVMREKKTPEKSLATVELWPEAGKFCLGQHLLSHNRPITNKSQLSFIKRWLKHIEGVLAASAT